MLRTATVKAVARALLNNPDQPHWGTEIAEAAKLPSSSTSRILTRFCNEGWLQDYREDAVSSHGRKARRYFRVTGPGRVELAKIIAHDAPPRPAGSDRQH
jgi:DNA-binding MarR family transcriptional regulator